MAKDVLILSAPCRLHCGMFSFQQPCVRAFGGVGFMVDRPGIRLRCLPAREFSVGPSRAATPVANELYESKGPIAAIAATGAVARVTATVRRLCETLQLSSLPDCRIEIESCPLEHTGLGVGTQLTLAVTALMHAWLDRPLPGARELVGLTGRSGRSAVGLYGFLHGGLIVEAGKPSGCASHVPETTPALSPLLACAPLPDTWRFVLLTPADEQGLHGEAERAAMASLPPVPIERTGELAREALLNLLPAALEGCFDAFAESLYRFGHTAGLCFASSQRGGAFASPTLADWVDWLRDQTIDGVHVRGVGQSSWGPTLFIAMPDADRAEKLVARIQQRSAAAQLVIAAPCNEPTRARRAPVATEDK